MQETSHLLCCLAKPRMSLISRVIFLIARVMLNRIIVSSKSVVKHFVETKSMQRGHLLLI